MKAFTPVVWIYTTIFFTGNVVLQKEISITLLGLGHALEQVFYSLTVLCTSYKLVINGQFESNHVFIFTKVINLTHLLTIVSVTYNDYHVCVSLNVASSTDLVNLRLLIPLFHFSGLIAKLDDIHRISILS